MHHIVSAVKHNSDAIIKLMPLFAFLVPLALLYFLNLPDPYLQVSSQTSFELMWKGRTFQLFFVWLIALEFILSWEVFKSKIDRQNTARLAAVSIALLLPTIYVLMEYYFGLNASIANFAMNSGVTFFKSMPLAIEYIVFSILFSLIALLYYGKKGLTAFALPALFVALVGVIYIIDNVFPYGQFTPFQLLVPTTAMLAAKTLGLMGYSTALAAQNGMPTLQVTGPLGTAKFEIAWPCAGIESLLIFTAVALLFLQRMSISLKAKIGYFAVGVAVVYFINILRIDTLFTIGMQYGVDSNQVQMFHYYYGPLYSIAWIASYPLIIILSQGLWQKFRGKNTIESQSKPTKPQPKQLDPV